MKDSLFSENKELLLNFIEEASSVGIVISQDQNIDNIAAGLSLYLSLKNHGKNVQIVSKKEPIVELSNLVGINKIKKNFDGNIKTFVISVPYREQEIQKVSYNTEEDRLNLNLFAYEDSTLSFQESEIRFIKKGSAPSLVFTIGIKTKEEIKELVDTNQDLKIINIDNSSLNSLWADMNLVDPSFSSFSEAVTKVLSEVSLPLDLDIAQNLLDGICYATNNCSSLSTTPLAFESVALLLRFNAKRKVFEKEQRENKPRILDPFNASTSHSQVAQNPKPASRNELNEEEKINSLLSNISREAQVAKQNNMNIRRPNNQNNNWNQSPKKNFNRQENWNKPQVSQSQPRPFPQQKPPIQTSVNIPPSPIVSEEERAQEENIPSDWLSPKIFNVNKNQE